MIPMSKVFQGRTLNFVVPTWSILTVAIICWHSASDITHLFTRQSPPLWYIVSAAFVLAFAIWKLPHFKLVRMAPLVLLMILAGISTLWSLSPADSIRVTVWFFVYASAFAVALAWPRLYLPIFVMTHLAILARGVDLAILLETDFLQGAWFNKNAQGAQFLQFVPVLWSGIISNRRWSPYLAIVTGYVLFLSTLTRSAAAQLLLALGSISILARSSSYIRVAFRPLTWLVLTVSLIGGAGLGYLTFQPNAIQVLGFGIGETDTISGSLDKTNTRSSLLHRLEMSDYVIRRGLEANMTGTGAGSFRDLYPGLKEKRGANVSDAHNYYLETFMTLGVIGAVLLVWSIMAPLIFMWRTGQFAVFVAAFCFAGYLAFDVPAYYPAQMTLFFGLLGTAFRKTDTAIQSTPRAPQLYALRLAYVSVALVLVVTWLWWTLPCSDFNCALERRFGDRQTAVTLFNNTVHDDAQIEFLDDLIQLNPESYWAHELRVFWYRESGDVIGYLNVARALAEDFPFANVDVYHMWEEAGLLARDELEVQQAVQARLTNYGPISEPDDGYGAILNADE